MSDARYRKVEVEPVVQNDIENPGPVDLVKKESLRVMKSQSRKEMGLINYDIAWSGVNFKVGEKVILDNCYGSVPAGTVCAVLGPSGKFITMCTYICYCIVSDFMIFYYLLTFSLFLIVRLG